LLKQKAAQVARPRTGRTTDAKGRHIPASVRREVWRRDQGKCAFVAADGRKCCSTSGVEFHHVQPYAVGGQATAGNIEMRCRAHNGFEWSRHLDEETAALVARD
jgi:5-methylcytosine-specific restriction endonuclease McrA